MAAVQQPTLGGGSESLTMDLKSQSMDFGASSSLRKQKTGQGDSEAVVQTIIAPQKPGLGGGRRSVDSEQGINFGGASFISQDSMKQTSSMKKTDSEQTFVEKLKSVVSPQKKLERAPTHVMAMGARSKEKSERKTRTSLRYGTGQEMAESAGGGVRVFCKELMTSTDFECVTGVVIVANFAVIALETDERARFLEASPGSPELAHSEEMLRIFWFINLAFLAFYCLECLCRMYVQRCEFFLHTWNIFDFLIVLAGIVCEILQASLESGETDGTNMGLLRSMRMIRLLRLPRVLISFQELYALICGLTNCMKTLMWAAALIFMTLTVWAIIAVEYIHPLMAALEEDGTYTTCAWCPGAFRSIMHSNLTFFQIVSGDGWSLLARSLIEKHPWTAIVFVGVIMVVVFGLLNLVIAAILDTAAQAREADIISLAYSKQAERDKAWSSFSNLVRELDSNGDGEISIAELRDGVVDMPELRAYLTVMNVTDEDLRALFDVLDSDGNGIVTHEEFTKQLYKMKTCDASINTFYIKHYCEDLRKEFARQLDLLTFMSDGMAFEGLDGAPSGTGPLQRQATGAVPGAGLQSALQRQATGWTGGAPRRVSGGAERQGKSHDLQKDDDDSDESPTQNVKNGSKINGDQSSSSLAELHTPPGVWLSSGSLAELVKALRADAAKQFASLSSTLDALDLHFRKSMSEEVSDAWDCEVKLPADALVVTGARDCHLKSSWLSLNYESL